VWVLQLDMSDCSDNMLNRGAVFLYITGGLLGEEGEKNPFCIDSQSR